MYDIDFISHENGNKLNTVLSFGERCKGKSTEKYAFCPPTMGVDFANFPMIRFRDERDQFLLHSDLSLHTFTEWHLGQRNLNVDLFAFKSPTLGVIELATVPKWPLRWNVLLVKSQKSGKRMGYGAYKYVMCIYIYIYVYTRAHKAYDTCVYTYIYIYIYIITAQCVYIYDDEYIEYTIYIYT